jgi:hypothetical protein
MATREGQWTIHVSLHARSDGAGTFTNMPAADTFLFSSHRHITKVDLTGMTYIRLKVNKQATAGNTGAKLILRYSPTFSTTVGSYIDIGTSECSVTVDVTNTYLDSGWIEIDDSAKDDVFIAVVGNGGNGTLDPTFGNISISAI